MSKRQDVEKRSVCAWLTLDDYDALRAIADSHAISISEYVRSIIVDAVAEDHVSAVLRASVRPVAP